MPWGLKRYYGAGGLHFITWSCYRREPLLGNPARRGQEIWSARITLSYRAPAIKREDGYLWFWIGDHETYDRLIS
jgi:hypothetical protein